MLQQHEGGHRVHLLSNVLLNDWQHIGLPDLPTSNTHQWNAEDEFGQLNLANVARLKSA